MNRPIPRSALQPSETRQDSWARLLRSSAHGRGLATEAVAAAIAWGDSNLAAGRTVCMVDPAHAASIRVAEKNGYREFERTTYLGRPTMLLDRRRPD